jgi:hypothetical protein
MPIPIILKKAAQLAINNDDNPTILSNVNWVFIQYI